MMSEQRHYESPRDTTMSGTGYAAPSPSPAPSISASQSGYGGQFTAPRPSPSPAPLTHQNSYGSHGSGTMPATPMYQSAGSYNQYNTASTPMASLSNAMANYSHVPYQSQPAPRPVLSASNSHSGHPNAYNPPRISEVYTLPEAANNAIAKEIRDQFRTDEMGRVFFYTAPPLVINPVPAEKQNLGHSLRYLADKARNRQSNAQKRKAYEEEREAEALQKSKRAKVDQETGLQAEIETNVNSIKKWSQAVDVGTDAIYQDLYGESWKEMREAALASLSIEQEKATLKQEQVKRFENERKVAKELRLPGRGL